MSRMPRIVTAAFALAMAAPANSHAENKKGYKDIHTIAIVSLLGNEVDMQTLGFAHVAYKLQTDWNIDEKLTKEIARLLASRFAIASPPDPHLFGPVGNGLFDFPVREIHRRIAAMPKNPGVDAYVVAFPFPLNSAADWLGPFVRRIPVFLEEEQRSLGFTTTSASSTLPQEKKSIMERPKYRLRVS